MRVQMRTELTKLHQRLQATMLYVTHDQVEAMTMGTRICVMKDGEVQQIDAPLTLYHQPANLFVAGFLGSPPMNFVHGRLTADGADGFLFKENDGVIVGRFAAAERPALRDFVGKEIVLGVRPEDIALRPGDSAPASRRSTPDGQFQAIVDIVEPMGAETNFYLQTGNHTVISRSQAAVDQREVGHRLRFAIDLAKAHLFDPVTTRRIV